MKYPNGITEEIILINLSKPVLKQCSHRQLAKRLGHKNHKSVYNWLKKLYEQGKITKNKQGIFCCKTLSFNEEIL